MREFSKVVKMCLKSKSTTCLEDLIPTKMYFPEQKDFGCTTADLKKHWYITPKEFSKCALSTTIKRTGCGDIDLNLAQVLADCFINPRAESTPKMLYFKGPEGSICHLKDQNGKLMISSIGCGC